MIRPHLWTNHNFVQVIVVDPHRSVVKTKIGGATRQCARNPRNAPTLFASLYQVDHFTRRKELDGSCFATRTSSFFLDALKALQLSTIFRLGCFPFSIQNIIHVVNFIVGVVNGWIEANTAAVTVGYLQKPPGDFHFGDFDASNEFQNFVAPELHRVERQSGYDIRV